VGGGGGGGGGGGLRVQLVRPLQASGFQYRPTRSPFKRKRIMMQQVCLRGASTAGARCLQPVLCRLPGRVHVSAGARVAATAHATTHHT
jgi:hypothetical protein